VVIVETRECAFIFNICLVFCVKVVASFSSLADVFGLDALAPTCTLVLRVSFCRKTNLLLPNIRIEG
jgi:hypothetical protein